MQTGDRRYLLSIVTIMLCNYDHKTSGANRSKCLLLMDWGLLVGFVDLGWACAYICGLSSCQLVGLG